MKEVSMNYIEKIKDFIMKNIFAVTALGVSVLSILGSFAYVYFNKCEECKTCEETIAYEAINENIEEIKNEMVTIKVDVKGAVKNPGVYELYDTSTVSDAINMAGGLTKTGITTNINLSKKVKDEMVIYVFTKNEITTKKPTNEIACETPVCKCEELVVNETISTDALKTIEQTTTKTTTTITTESNIDENTKISINTDSIEELMKLSGIGEAKAKAIIEYRKTNGNFTSIEDIKNVSGIGDKAYEKIKDNITI